MNLRDFPLREPESGGRCARGDKVGAARRSTDPAEAAAIRHEVSRCK